MSEDKPFVKYELPVVLAGTPHSGTLELWASPEESPYVEWSLQTETSYRSMGLPPVVAAQLADALAQVGLGAEGEFVADGFDDDDESPATLHTSWDNSGVDFVIGPITRGVVHDRIVMDDDNFEQAAQVVQALRECVATLVVDCTTHQEFELPGDVYDGEGLATLLLTGQRRGGQWSISVVPQDDTRRVLGTVRIDLTATEDPDVAITTAKAWLDAECGHLNLKCVGYRNHNSEYGDDERPFFATARVVVADLDWE